MQIGGGAGLTSSNGLSVWQGANRIGTYWTSGYLAYGGGLLIVYGKSIIGNGTMLSQGLTYGAYDNPTNRYTACASSGGGSINVFCEETDNKMNFKCDGVGYSSYAWRGGNGTYSFGTISNGMYQSIK